MAHMAWQERIEVNPKILVGKPLIKGTRISIALILELLAHGWGQKEILRNYPQLREEDITAALEYSAHPSTIRGIYLRVAQKSYTA